MIVVAVVGTGFIGPVHVEALRRVGVSVRGILGIDKAQSEAAAQALGLEVAYADYAELLADEQVTTVHIATPNRLHYPFVKQALEANKHVICEKPLAMNTEETAELVALTQSKPDLVTAVNYNLRYYPMVLQAREIVRSGTLGDIYAISGAYQQDWLLKETDWNWRLLAKEGGALRAIGDIGTHWMDMAHFITGLDVTALTADLATFHTTRKKPRQAVATFVGKEQDAPIEYDEVAIDTEDWGAVMFRYTNGARGVMHVSQVNAGRKNQLRIEIAGSNGSLCWDGERPNELWLGHRDQPQPTSAERPGAAHGSCIGTRQLSWRPCGRVS